MSDEKRPPVLGDHQSVKRKLIPPAVRAFGGKLALYSWTRQLVPEAIWLGLVIDRCGYQAARKLCQSLVIAAHHAHSSQPSPLFVKMSAYSGLDATAQAQVLAALDEQALAELRVSLSPLRSISPTHPLAFLGREDDIDPAVADRFPAILQEFYDRHARLAVLSLALAYELGIAQGKVHVAEHLVKDLNRSFENIGDFPETEASHDAAGRFRAAAPMLFMTPTDDGDGFSEDDSWVGLFWDGIAGFGPCLHPDTVEDEQGDDGHPLERFVREFRNAVRSDLRARLNRWPLDLNEVEAYEVVVALLCRQATLAIEFAAAPSMWSPHSAPITLRAMADVFISLAWILRDPGPRARKFVEDGLGAIKLHLAHQERALETATDADDIEEMRQMIEVWREWLTMQRMEQFVEVNLGSWSGLNTRKMAEEAGFLDFYNYVYQPFSGVAHSNWSHVSMFNTVFCQNPAHRGHRAPAIAPIEPDTHWLFLASKYLRKTLSHFDDVNSLTGLRHEAFEYLIGEDDLNGEAQ